MKRAAGNCSQTVRKGAAMIELVWLFGGLVVGVAIGFALARTYKALALGGVCDE